MDVSTGDLVSAIRGTGGTALFVPDLTLWFEWHDRRGTLPPRWRGSQLADICADLGVPAWVPVKPWRIRLEGIEVEKAEEPTERTVRWKTPHGTLQSRWTLGPDGDWWHEEYPVKTAEDLKAAMAVVSARRYVLDAEARGGTAAGGVIELPMRPFAEIFSTFLGWSEGLFLFLEEPEVIGDMLGILEQALADAEKQIVRMPGVLALAPDNLDAQFMAPASFDEHLAPSYRRTADLLHAAGKLLVVHGGGPLAGLLPGLAASGVDCVEGVCGPPQSDASLAEARALCGPDISLWGGISQDSLLSATDVPGFRAAARAAFREARRDPRAIVGVADKVPVEALPDRIEELARMSGE